MFMTRLANLPDSPALAAERRAHYECMEIRSLLIVAISSWFWQKRNRGKDGRMFVFSFCFLSCLSVLFEINLGSRICSSFCDMICLSPFFSLSIYWRSFSFSMAGFSFASVVLALTYSFSNLITYISKIMFACLLTIIKKLFTIKFISKWSCWGMMQST